MSINLFVNYYKTDNEQRTKEIHNTFVWNRSVFDKVHLIGTTPICDIPFPVQPTFNDFIFYVNYYSNEDDINVIANSDIRFTKESLSYIKAIPNNHVYAISRYNDNALFCRKDSQDAWIFKGHIEDLNAPFHLGIPGCDNHISYLLTQAGYTISNPAFDIVTDHIHADASRTHKPVIKPPYLHVPIKSNGTVYATSINPYARLEEQKSAISTWKNGNIISVNTRKEIDDLYPMEGVTFVETDQTVNGKYIKLDAIINAFKNIYAERYILINSDISITSDIPKTDNMLIGARHDDGDTLFPWGYDVFSMTKAHLDAVNPSDYALGLPWWDFFLPLSILKKGHKIDVVKNEPIFTHEWHETRYDMKVWHKYGEYSKRQYCFPRFGGTIPEFCTATKKYIDSKMNVIA